MQYSHSNLELLQFCTFVQMNEGNYYSNISRELSQNRVVLKFRYTDSKISSWTLSITFRKADFPVFILNEVAYNSSGGANEYVRSPEYPSNVNIHLTPFEFKSSRVV